MVLLDASSGVGATDNVQKVKLPAAGAALPSTTAYGSMASTWKTPGQANQEASVGRQDMAFGGRLPAGSPPQAAAAAAGAGYGYPAVDLNLPENTAPQNPNYAAANLAVAPTARPNPHAFVVMNPGYYTVLSNALTEALDQARAMGQPYVDVGKGRQVDIGFRQCPSIPDAGVNQKGDCYEFLPRWFFLDNRQRWSPMSPHMNYTLTKGKFEGSQEERDSERTYDLVTYNQINRESGRRRPLLYLRDDGTAVRGDAVAMWAYEGLFRGAPATVAVPFEIAEHLDRGFNQGAPEGTVTFKMSGATTPAKCKITFAPGGTAHDADVDDGSGFTKRYKFIRYYPTWFFLDEDRHWCSLDYATTTRLDIAQSNGQFVAQDREREYDLVRLEQLNMQSGKARPLVHVLGHNGTAPGSTPASHSAAPQIFERAKMITDGAVTLDALKSKINDTSLPEIHRLLYFCNGLVHFHRFVIKGGILRDAVVKNDISKSHDIDIELPQVFQQHQLDGWISKFLSEIEQQFGVKRDPSKEVVKRNSWDVLGPAVGRASVSEGIVTIPVVLPNGGPALDLECVTPWNTAYNPPSNVDVSINNLRVTADSNELLQNVPLFYGTNGQERYSVADILDQITRGDASPCYDFRWIDGDSANGKTGEGFSKLKWCQGFNELNPVRAKLMDGRFDKMRSKGYRLVEAPKQ